MVTCGRARHRDVYTILGVLDHLDINPLGDFHSMFQEHRLGITHETSLQGTSFQQAANSEASWFFCSVIGLSFFETSVSESWLDSSSQHASTGKFGLGRRNQANGTSSSVPRRRPASQRSEEMAATSPQRSSQATVEGAPPRKGILTVETKFGRCYAGLARRLGRLASCDESRRNLVGNDRVLVRGTSPVRWAIDEIDSDTHKTPPSRFRPRGRLEECG